VPVLLVRCSWVCRRASEPGLSDAEDDASLEASIYHQRVTLFYSSELMSHRTPTSRRRAPWSAVAHDDYLSTHTIHVVAVFGFS